jgi:hypothetical protein
LFGGALKKGFLDGALKKAEGNAGIAEFID